MGILLTIFPRYKTFLLNKTVSKPHQIKIQMLGGKPNLRSKLYKVRTIMHNKILDFFLGGDAL